MGCKNIIAEPREVEDVSIKGLEVEVAPCAAHVAIVSRVGSCEFKISCKKWLKIPSLNVVNQLVQGFILSLNIFPLPTSLVIFCPSMCYETSHYVFILIRSQSAILSLLFIIYTPINGLSYVQVFNCPYLIWYNSSTSYCFLTILFLLLWLHDYLY